MTDILQMVIVELGLDFGEAKGVICKKNSQSILIENLTH